MNVKTRNYRLNKSDYVKITFKAVLKRQWWVALIVLAIASGYFWIPSFWWVSGALIAAALYLLFWWIQFYGVTQLDQGKMLFERFSYEINSQQIVMKINPREGMPVKWEQIKRAVLDKNGYILFLNKAQIIHLPTKVFNTENERKFVGSILKKKGLLK